MVKKTSLLIGKARWKSFVFFLFLAAFFWVLTKFSKEYAAPVTAKLVYVNVPADASLGEGNEEEVGFNLFGSGFQFLQYTLKKPELLIDVSKYTNNGGKARLSATDIANEIDEQFPSLRSASSITKDELLIKLDDIIRKKVKVVIPQDLIFKKGFKQVNGLLVVPDSVSISGPEESMKKIDSVITQTLVLKNLDGEQSRKLTIVAPELPDVTINTTAVNVTVNVAEFTQRDFVYDVIVLNKPETVNIKLIPQKVKISFDVAVSDFNAIKKEDFKLICDYANRNTSENFMIPELISKPDNVFNIEFETQKVDFLVFKK